MTPPWNTPCGRQEIDGGRGAADDDECGLGAQNLARADQRRPAVAAELRGVAILIDDAILFRLWNDPVRRRRIRPHFDHPDHRRAHARAGNVGNDYFLGRREFCELRRQRRYFLQQHVARFQAIHAGVAAGAVAKQTPFQERVADVDQQVVRGHAGRVHCAERARAVSDRVKRPDGASELLVAIHRKIGIGHSGAGAFDDVCGDRLEPGAIVYPRLEHDVTSFAADRCRNG